MKKFLLSMLGGMMLTSALAQNFTVAGTITEVGTGNPISNHAVYVYADSTVLNYYNVVYTDINGNYSDVVPGGGIVGPNLYIWVSTDSCNAWTGVTFQNMQGTITSGTADFIVCAGNPSGNTPCDAGFQAVDSANTGYVYFFANNTNSNVTYAWDFGDGSTGTGINPIHYYSQPGTYLACLTIDSLGLCTSTSCDTIVISAGNGMCIADFWWFEDSTMNTIYLINNSTGGMFMSYAWDFGDGNTGTGAYPTHVYANYGQYYVCLTISDGMGCTATYCDWIIFTPFQGGNSRTGFTVNVIAPTSLGVDDEIETINALEVYPNPANGNLNINFASSTTGKVEVAVTDLLGKSVSNTTASVSTGDNKLNMDVSGFENGMYVITVRDIKTGKAQTIRFIKQ